MDTQTVEQSPEISEQDIVIPNNNDPTPEAIIEQIKKKHEEIVNATNEELESINTRILVINTQLQELVTKIKKTDSEITGNSDKIALLESEKKDLDKKIEALNKDKDTISSKLHGLQISNAEIDSEKNILTKEIEAKKEEINAANSTINALEAKKQGEIDHRLTVAQGQWEQAINKKQAQLEAANKEHDTLVSTLKDDYEGQIKGIKTGEKETEGEYKKKLESYESRLQNLIDNFKKKNGLLELLQSQVKDLNKQKSNNEAKILELTEKNEDLLGHNTTLVDTRDNKSKEMERLKSDNEKLRKQLNSFMKLLTQVLENMNTSNTNEKINLVKESLQKAEDLLNNKNNTTNEIDTSKYHHQEVENNVNINVGDKIDHATEIDGGKRKKSKSNTKKVKHSTTKNKHKRLNGNKKKQTQKRRSRKGKKVNRKK